MRWSNGFCFDGIAWVVGSDAFGLDFRAVLDVIYVDWVIIY